MPKRTRNSPGGKSVLAILLLSVMGAGVLAAYVRLSPQAAHVANGPRQADPEITIQSHRAKSGDNAVIVKPGGLMIPGMAGNDVALQKPAGDTPMGVQPEVFLLNQTVQSMEIDGARALGVDVKDHLAIISFNPAIEKGYGTIEEGNLIKALQMALGQFPDIERFRLMVEGKLVESLGNIDLTTPVEVIRPGQSAKPVEADSHAITP